MSALSTIGSLVALSWNRSNSYHFRRGTDSTFQNMKRLLIPILQKAISFGSVYVPIICIQLAATEYPPLVPLANAVDQLASERIRATIARSTDPIIESSVEQVSTVALNFIKNVPHCPVHFSDKLFYSKRLRDPFSKSSF